MTTRLETLSKLTALTKTSPKSRAFVEALFGFGINDADTAEILLSNAQVLKRKNYVGENFLAAAAEFSLSVKADTKPAPSAPEDSFDLSEPIWIGEWYGDNPWSAVRAAAEKAGSKRFVFISYAIPNRDLGSYSAGGMRTCEDYWKWSGIVADAAKAGTKPICVLEPDALGHSREMSVADRDVRFQSLQGAIDAYNAVGIEVWVDASMWVPAEEMATMAPATTSWLSPTSAGSSCQPS